MYYSNVSDIRPEDVHPFVKNRNTNKIVRYFDKEKSVFHPWKALTPLAQEQAFASDLEKNKITKLIKNDEDVSIKKPNFIANEFLFLQRDATLKYLKENYVFLLECYLELQYNSVYPFVNKIEMANFAEKSKLIDEKLNMSNCDLLFVSSHDQKKGGIKQKMGLIRCEFMEYIVRLAAFKYIASGTVKTYLEAVQLVLDRYIKPNFKPMSWQLFRDEELWTLEVNDVFETNLEGIMKLHNNYYTPTQRYMSDKDATNLLTKDGKLDLTYTQAKYCLSFCKMPIKDECAEFDKYRVLQPVELMEMIGRAAKAKFTNTVYDDEPLERRIEMVLDLLFPIVQFKRREVKGGAESESQSDEDY